MIPELGPGFEHGLSEPGLRLRPWRLGDADVLAAAWADPEIAARLPVPADRDVTAAGRWIEGWEQRRAAGVALDLVISAPPDDEVRGEIGLSRFDPARRAAQIGWWLAEPWRGRGLASRAVRLTTRWVFESGWLDVLLAEIDDDNRASLEVAARCGYEPLGRGSGGRLVVVRRASPGGEQDLRNPQEE